MSELVEENGRLFVSMKNDVMFKLVLDNPKFVAYLLRYLFNEEVNPSDIEYLDRESHLALEVKASLMDVRFVVYDTDYDIENQTIKPNYDMNIRMMKYVNDMFSASIEKGSIYECNKAIAICFISYDIGGEGNWYYEYKWKNQYNKDIPYLMIYYICVKNSEKCDKMELRRCLDIYKSPTPEEYRGDDSIMNEMIDKIISEQSSKASKERIRREEEYQRIIEAEKYGAVKEALKQGLEEGEKKNSIANAKNAIAAGLTNELINQITGLFIEEIEDLRKN